MEQILQLLLGSESSRGAKHHFVAGKDNKCRLSNGTMSDGKDEILRSGDITSNHFHFAGIVPGKIAHLIVLDSHGRGTTIVEVDQDRNLVH